MDVMYDMVVTVGVEYGCYNSRCWLQQKLVTVEVEVVVMFDMVVTVGWLQYMTGPDTGPSSTGCRE